MGYAWLFGSDESQHCWLYVFGIEAVARAAAAIDTEHFACNHATGAYALKILPFELQHIGSSGRRKSHERVECLMYLALYNTVLKWTLECNL